MRYETNYHEFIFTLANGDHLTAYGLDAVAEFTRLENNRAEMGIETLPWKSVKTTKLYG